ncbi:dipeptide epimerase [Streptomyces cellulosae]|uniref:Dipeptide epimerase n=1 Tax=Streptomyces thermodiastaticus TaxID=44061 RepID=A0ABU0KEH2_9ACTN|nr:L-alanine-DL-glutamate epimerase-like enolase superfamily enzyme [Streptomyces thermodiastaticus]MYW50412.1 dipeptide epimerase [Streptomyces sp. SID8376]UVT13474.1 dipeptide epimerase [Streptomyces thermocarboxydus]WSB45320.1 dipeptide epimerase [Streptomyces cellulosae]WSB58155.1 dipeptide epimerase [Streptomyces cellulosae]
MKAATRTVRLGLTEPLRISRSTMAARDAVWLSVEHGGVTGHGEAVTSVYYGLDTATLHRCFADVARELRRYPDPAAALESLRSGELAGGTAPPAVRAAVESALLDLVGIRAGRPVHRLLGLPQPPVAATARTIGITSPLDAAAQARALTVNGFEVLKVKAGLPDPEEDVERLRVVRDAAPRARLLLDPNGAWTPRQAAALLPRFAGLGVEAVEQPVAPGDPEALAALAERSPLPVIADEDAVGLEDVRRLAGRVHGVNVKLAKCGGPHAALRIAETIAGSGTQLMLGCLTASSLGLAPAVHLAGLARWTDLDGHLLLAHDPWTGIGGEDGYVRTSGLPGLGVEPREVGPGPRAAVDAA